MKSKKVLALSLVLNVVLVSVVAWAIKTPASSPSISTTNEVQSESSLTSSQPRPRPVVRKSVDSTPTLPRQLNWREVDSRDPKIFMANLRAIGCPEQTIRDIITSRLNKSVAAQRAAIRRGGDEFVYWKPDVEYTDYYPKLRQERALEREKSATLRELFGSDPNEQTRREAGTYDYMEWQYDFLSGDKREKAREIQERYVDMGREVKSAGSSNPDVQRKVRELYDQRLVELAKFLTPEEVEEYDLCSSSLSESMRSNLDGFNPTADEFRKIYRIKKSTDSGSEGQQQEEAAIRQLLGEQRYAQYERTKDYSYRELHRLVRARDLPADSVDQIWEIKTLTEANANEVWRNSNLTLAQKRESIQKNHEEVTASLVKIMGQNNFEMYRSRSAWLQRVR